MRNSIRLMVLLAGCVTAGCFLFPPPEPPAMDDGPVAPGVTGRLGEPMPSLSAEQLATFQRGKAVLTHRFSLAQGLGPTFNVVSCGACHERPAGGGASALYRNFFIAGRVDDAGAFQFSESAGKAGGVLRVFSYDANVGSRPAVPATTTVFAQRHGIPMFGVGLMAEIPDDEILSRSDPDDLNGDGISGRPNFDRGFVGRFGRKCQTVSIEGFIRGPLFNHLGVTTNPLSNEQLAAQLPVDSSARRIIKDVAARAGASDPKFGPHEQAAADDGPNSDADGVSDPEMSTQDLFDLVSFSMMLAAPQFDTPTEQTNHGRLLFHEANCSACHVPRVSGPRGPIPAYSDFLLHDMGPGLADGIVMKDAKGFEFRTQPLWGVAATAPYLHDGREDTLKGAILAHGGEAQAARDAFAAFSDADQTDLVEFLKSLGGRDQASAGLLTPDAAVPEVGEFGGPVRTLTMAEMDQFLRGRAIFDKDFSFNHGAGGMAGSDGVGRFNGDSCRACHFDPVIGGSGPRDVNVMRHGIVNDQGDFSPPQTTPNTILHKEIRVGDPIVTAEADCNVFEHRQTPHLFGAGLVDSIDESTILSHEDPNDGDSDGISGRANMLSDGRVGRFGWKADVPSLAEFLRDAMGAELGLTMAPQEGLTFGITQDQDGVADPELTSADGGDALFFMSNLAPPPRQAPSDAAAAQHGEELFTSIGCARCHIPSMPGSFGDVPLFSDLLLHEILPSDTKGIVSQQASQLEFRTAPLWGLSRTAPYFHTGLADTVDQAIRLHDGEAAYIRSTYEALPSGYQHDLLVFLDTL